MCAKCRKLFWNVSCIIFFWFLFITMFCSCPCTKKQIYSFRRTVVFTQDFERKRMHHADFKKQECWEWTRCGEKLAIPTFLTLRHEYWVWGYPGLNSDILSQRRMKRKSAKSEASLHTSAALLCSSHKLLLKCSTTQCLGTHIYKWGINIIPSLLTVRLKRS